MGIEVLPAADAILWGVQRPEAPLQIAGLAFFEGAPLHDDDGRLRLDELRRRVAATLASSPRFRCRLVALPFGTGAAWVDDADFAVEHHVGAVTLEPPGDEVRLRAEIARLVGRPLDRRRPLWAITLVDGLADGRVALLIEASHVLLDGMALLELAFHLLETDPDAPPPPPAEPWVPSPSPPPWSLALAGSGERVRQVGSALAGLGRLAVDPDVLRAAAGSAVGAARSVVGALTGRQGQPTDRAPFTGRVGGRRAVAWTRLPLDDVRAVARRSGATVNDVVLALTAGAVGGYLDVHPEGPRPAETKVIVPLSVHGEAGEEVENRFGVVVARIPTGLTDPTSVLEGIHRQLAGLRHGAGSSVGARIFTLVGLVPPWLVHVGGRMALDRQGVADLAVTNLRGPAEPYHLLGARMLEVHPLVTGTGNIATIVGVLSYADGLGVCATVDADVVPDPEVLVDGFGRALDRLVESYPG